MGDPKLPSNDVRQDSREVYEDVDWAEYEAYLDGTLNPSEDEINRMFDEAASQTA